MEPAGIEFLGAYLGPQVPSACTRKWITEPGTSVQHIPPPHWPPRAGKAAEVK